MECKMSLVCALDMAHSVQDASHLAWFIMEISHSICARACTYCGSLYLAWFALSMACTFCDSHLVWLEILSAGATLSVNHTEC